VIQKERKKTKGTTKDLRIVSPIGAVPTADVDLNKRLASLGENPSISQVLKEMGKWEKAAVNKYREREQTAKSGILDIVCSR
jgi:hypothetical protein